MAVMQNDSDQVAAIAEKIRAGKTSLGIEFGSTRIKAVLIDDTYRTIASGDYGWASHLEHGLWSYTVEEIWKGLQTAYAEMAGDVEAAYGEKLTHIGHIGFSAMMHGYLAFDEAGELLVPFRTWQNTNTHEAHEKLSELFQYNIPERWSIAHLYQCVLDNEEHVSKVAFFTTLAGYVHWKLTGRKVLGVGDASGMFPIDPTTRTWEAEFIRQFNELPEVAAQPWKLEDLLPEPLVAGTPAGELTEEGAKLLDPTGTLQPGITLAPPEGDAGTGMAATDSVAPRTGNVSAGTSIFAMVVLERPLRRVYPEIDLVTTPDGAPVAMVHCNNCTSDLNAWVDLLVQAAALGGTAPDKGALFTKLFELSLQGAPDAGGIVPVNYYSGEGVTHFDAGCPLLLRGPESAFTLPNLMRAHIYSAMATLALGLDILHGEEVAVDTLTGHGGLFKTPGVAQRYLAAAAAAPVTVRQTAGEGGPYGMALLAAYALNKAPGETLAAYLHERVFAGAPASTLAPTEADRAGFTAFLGRYRGALQAERAALQAENRG